MPRPRPVTVWSYNTPLPRPTSREEWIETEVEIEGEHNEMGGGDVVHVDHFHWVNGSTTRSVSDTWESDVETSVHSTREVNHHASHNNSSRFNVVSRQPPPPPKPPQPQRVAPPVHFPISRLPSVAPEVMLNSWDDEELPVLPDGSVHDYTPTHVSPPLAPSPILRSTSGSVQGSGVYKRDQPVRFASDALHHVVCNEFVNNHSFSKTPSDMSSRHPSLRRLSGSKGSASPMRYSFRVQPSESSESELETAVSPPNPPNPPAIPADTLAGFVYTPVVARNQSEGSRDGISPLSTSREPSLPTNSLPSRSALTSPPRDSPPRSTSIGIQSEATICREPPTDTPLTQPPTQPPVTDHSSSLMAFNMEVHQQYMGLLRTALEGNISVATALTNVALEAVQHKAAPQIATPPPPVQPLVLPTPHPTAVVGNGGVRARDLFGYSPPKRITPPTVSPTSQPSSSSSSSSGDCEGDYGDTCRYHRHRRREGAVVRIQRHVRPIQQIQQPLRLMFQPSPPRSPPKVAASSSTTRREYDSHTVDHPTYQYKADTAPRSVHRDPVRVVDSGTTYQRPPSPVSHPSIVNNSFSDHSFARRGSSISVSTSTRALGSRYRSPSLPDVQAAEDVDVSTISRRSSASHYIPHYRSTSQHTSGIWQPTPSLPPTTSTYTSQPSQPSQPPAELPAQPQPKSPREDDALGSTVVFPSTPLRPIVLKPLIEEVPEQPQVRRPRLLAPPPSPPRSPGPTYKTESIQIPKVNKVPTAHSSRTVSASSYADVESTTSPIATEDVRRASASVSRSHSMVSVRKTISMGTVREAAPHEPSRASVSTRSSVDEVEVNAKHTSTMNWLSVDSTPFQKPIDPTSLQVQPTPTTITTTNPQPLREVSPSRFVLRTAASSSSTSTISHSQQGRTRPRFQVPSLGQTPH